MRRLRLAAALAAAALAACAGPGYYFQAVSGHLALMHSRQDIDTLLAQAPTDDPRLPGLRLSREILDFAEAALGLEVGTAYRRYAETGREAVVWNVVATPEFSLEPRRWCFPFAGCVPYRGYFDHEDALSAAERFRRRDLDATVSPAAAYSTLGWFEDPVLDTMLAQDDASLAGTLFHELAHRRLYLPGDAAFSESYARFVEIEGVAAWLSARGDESAVATWRERQRLQDSFMDLLRETRGELTALYAQDLAPDAMRRQKAAVFRQLETRYREGLTGGGNHRGPFDAFFDSAPNNADLALLAVYEDGRCAFAALFRSVGHDWKRFHGTVAAVAERGEAERGHWLRQRC